MRSAHRGWLQSLLLAAGLVFGMVETASGFDITITVAPNVINMGSEGTVVTVHTDIAYGAVDVYSVVLNGVPISAWKSDDRGFFVAKFVMDQVKGILVEDEVNELTLLGKTTEALDSEAFSGSDGVWVVNNEPQGGGR